MYKFWFWFFGFWFLFSTSSKASDDFITHIAVTYKFDLQGRSKVEQKISLTNRHSELYPNSYVLTLNGESPSNIKGFDALGQLKISTTPHGPDGVTLSAILNDPAVGKGKTSYFTITYDGKSATRNGHVWEVVLPKFGSSTTTDKYTLSLVVPQEFAKAGYVSPRPDETITLTDGYKQYIYSSSNIAKNGVIASFGSFQVFNVDLSYHLANTSLLSVTKTIALPPDTPYQKLYYDTLDPKPDNVTVDLDGNWIATYTLSPKSDLTVQVKGQAQVVSTPYTSQLSLSNPQNYLDSSDVWSTQHPQVSTLVASGLTTPEKIYDYVVESLTYDATEVSVSRQRRTTSEIMSSPRSSICTDFADLFVTIARSAGIPARELEGYAYSSDIDKLPSSLGGDILHSWAEYWDESQKTWISIDPTWGKTSGGLDYFHKLDFHHLVFAIHGSSPSSPVPAGLYAKADPTKPDIRITTGEFVDRPVSKLVIDWRKPWQLWPLSQNISYVRISNPGPAPLYHIPVTINSDVANSIPILPPFAHVDIPVKLPQGFFPKFTPQFLAISALDSNITYNVPGSLVIFWQISFTLVFTFCFITLAIIAHKAWGVHFQKHSR